ncbi:MAG: glycoside hydrolase family 2 [Lewinellaceae bacterium]|nr:glycoside hydrolase family 2 [Lewinellaceae bacterium]
MISDRNFRQWLRTLTLQYGLVLGVVAVSSGQQIPLPEHPRPDWERPSWVNLNGSWDFAFDPANTGIFQQWDKGLPGHGLSINVPFPWGSALSGVPDSSDIAWYQRTIQVDPGWEDKKTFLIIGASDWETTVWLDGNLLGTHQGGYTPFEFDLTPYVHYGEPQKLVIRVDDVRRDFTLYGKQGYGNARGLWQTVYLEARGQMFLDAVQFHPDIDHQKVQVVAFTTTPPQHAMPLVIKISGMDQNFSKQVDWPEGKSKLITTIDMPGAKRWDLENPNLYNVSLSFGEDVVTSYFGMRKISVMNMPGTNYRYVALNNQPIYLQLTLDQSYHPEGFYTFPSDQFMREEIERSKSIGLNGIRTHIKVDIPRKLYWADKLGLLVMSDLPNFWGEPTAEAKAESTHTLHEMIKRDFNHPAIFSWIVFNETWGLFSEVEENGKLVRRYLKETQDWVASMYYLAKSLDQTRLVEDNSICCGRGHTETDLNSWHMYLPGWEWESTLKEITDSTYSGSGYFFEDGFTQGTQPLFNSECGNVWGYDGSTGDVDWSWDYHKMINAFRMFPKNSGWLYTEHHDVINEWNGYWRFDRTQKFTGVEEMVPGMTLNDWHDKYYLSAGIDICREVMAGGNVDIPLFASFMTGDVPEGLILEWNVTGTNTIGDPVSGPTGTLRIPSKPWMQQSVGPLKVTMPDEPGVYTLAWVLKAGDDASLHRNFLNFIVYGKEKVARVIDIPAKDFSASDWSVKQWDVLDGKKENGAGHGYFEYRILIPADLSLNGSTDIYFQAEVGAKELFAKDRDEALVKDMDYMLGARVENSKNSNAYPMTDEMTFPGEVRVKINGVAAGSMKLPDDPADHRGVLSWHHQLRDRKLREAGSYGYYLRIPIEKSALRRAQKTGYLNVRLEAPGEAGLAIYGNEFGRYMLNPGIVVKYKKKIEG